jgi:hypothetical protein
MEQKLAALFKRDAGPAKAWDDPESKNFGEIWIPAFAGMTVKSPKQDLKK